MKCTRISSIHVVLAAIAIAMVIIALSLAPQSAFAGSKDPSVLPVLLVPGHGGWGNSKSDWLSDGWMAAPLHPVGGESRWEVYRSGTPTSSHPGVPIFDKASVYSLDYHGYKDASGPLKQNAGILAKAIDVVTKDSGAAEVYVIAHSQGGLMTRAVMEGLALDPKDGSAIPYKNNIFGFMTIDTPHRGSSTNPWFQLDQGAGQDMLDNSPFLKELNAVPTSIDPATFCSIAVGDALGEAYGDGLFSADEQTPIDGTVPSSHYEKKEFKVVHGHNMPLTWPPVNYNNYTAATASSDVKDWAIEQYREAAKKYRELNSPSTGSNTALVIDVSDTMSEEYQGEIKLTQAKNAANGVAGIIAGYGNMTKTGAQVAVSSFSDSAATVQPLTSDVAAIRASVDSLQSQGSTNVGAGIEDGLAQLDAAASGAQKVMILLSDGLNNTGMTNDEVLAGPVAEAAQKHIKIFTVGFGEVGDLDPVFLQEIADATGGMYQLADATSIANIANSLAGTFALAQVTATSTKVLAQNQGTVAQDQTTQAGTFVVPNVSGDVRAVLLWPGSKLRLDLTDPAGTKVGAGYPGFAQSTTPGPAQIVIQGAKAGKWTSSVYGEQVSMPNEPFYSIVSFKKVKHVAVSAGGGGVSNDSGGLIMAVIVVALGAVVVWLIIDATRRNAGGEGSGLGTPARAMLVDRSGRRYAIHAGLNTLGRDWGNDIEVVEPSVSRRHAQLSLSAAGVEVADLGSTGGVALNGRLVLSAVARDGDELRFGEVPLTLRMGRSADE